MDQLNADHYGLEKVKKRIVEYIAVRNLKGDMKGPLICLVGPPGVGKTSLGKSVASALNRKFYRLSLGGVRDEAEIRGHRRTYIGAMPGSIMQALKRAGTSNPVILLDEIDKLGSDVRGDPASALLEVLDPAQNKTFTDHYINLPFDLSRVFFLSTANNVGTIPAPLLDRMELVQLPGYIAQEKAHIAQKYILPRQLEDHGISPDELEVSEDAVFRAISGWTREAGVRNLEREIANLCRHVAVKVVDWASTHQPEQEIVSVEETQDSAEGDNGDDNEADEGVMQDSLETKEDDGIEMEDGEDDAQDVLLPPTEPFPKIVVTPEMLDDILGQEKFEHESALRVSTPGVATGMAWTQAGGELLFIEASRMSGTGSVTITGSLGDVMKESARIAQSWIRANADMIGDVLGMPTDALGKKDTEHDLHIHFPAGAVPKDGPSAGVAITTALVSLLTGTLVRSDTSMTGEVSLRGLVMPVGGVKEKILAAHRGGIKHIILPDRNQKDLEELPDEVRHELTFTFAKHLKDVLEVVFDKGGHGDDDMAISHDNLQSGGSGDIGGVVVKSSNQHSFRASGNEEGGVPDLCGPILLSNM